MTEPIKTPPADGGVDLSNFVPKSEVESIKAQLESTNAGLKKDLDEFKLKLVDPEYISFLSSKKKVKEAEHASEGLKVPQEVQSVLDGYGKQITQLNTALQHVAAMLELSDVEKKYKDFDSYREDVQKILEGPAGTHLTIEQAYKLARQEKKAAEDEEEEEKKPKPKGTEKPTGISPGAKDSDAPPVFKTTEDANKATVAALKEKYGERLDGDII